MKTSYLILLLAATISLRSKAEVLLDTNGNAVQPGLKYYMVSSVWGGGSVEPTPLAGSTVCPSYVGQAPVGVPVIINPVNRLGATTIELPEKVTIQFAEVQDCVVTPYWTMAGNGLLATGGTVPTVPAPYLGGFDNLFSFYKTASNSYRFAYCQCNMWCKTYCYDVIKRSVDGQTMLAGDLRTVLPYYTVVFFKAEDAGAVGAHPLPSSASVPVVYPTHNAGSL